MTSSAKTSPPAPTTHQGLIVAQGFFQSVGAYKKLPEEFTQPDAFSNLIRSLVKPNLIERGRVTGIITVNRQLANVYGTLHGGAVGSVAEFVAVACAKTVVEKDLFLGELAVSYLSAAVVNVELEVCGSIVRQGRNVTVVSVEFRMKETRKLVYSARATFYNVPIANL